MKKITLLLIAVFASAALYAQVADSAKRHVVLHGAANFRDLGGYETADGHHVIWGAIYRSADISKLTDSDLRVLKDRKIDYDVDLRGHRESAQAPDKLNPGMDYILLPAGSDGTNNWLKDMAKLKAGAGDSLMIAYYSNIDSMALRYKPFFEKLLMLPPGEALVFHCTAGKDRTGIGAALLLYSLGVPYDTIISDFLASNYYRKDVNVTFAKQMSAAMHIDPMVAKAMLGVSKADMDATFSAINKRYGSIDIYLRTQIGLDDAKIAILKKKFLE